MPGCVGQALVQALVSCTMLAIADRRQADAVARGLRRACQRFVQRRAASFARPEQAVAASAWKRCCDRADVRPSAAALLIRSIMASSRSTTAARATDCACRARMVRSPVGERESAQLAGRSQVQQARNIQPLATADRGHQPQHGRCGDARNRGAERQAQPANRFGERRANRGRSVDPRARRPRP